MAEKLEKTARKVARAMPDKAGGIASCGFANMGRTGCDKVW